VLAGSPSWWPEELWAKPLASASCDSKGPVTVQVETRDPSGATDDDDKKAPGVRPTPPAHERVAHLARRAAMAWPNEDKAPRAIARFEDGELYGALRTFGDGKVLGLASADLLTNLGLSVPGNAAALVAMLQALDAREFAVASTGQGILPPSNPLAGLLRIGLGPALVHAAFFLPILLLAYGTRQAAPRDTTPRPRRSFAEHVRAVGSLYARRRAASHALSVYARFVDGRLRSRMPRGGEPAQFLADRAGADLADTLRVYARAMRAQPGQPLVGDEIATIARLSLLYEAALSRK
jgi:hypothetical protein